MNRLVLVFLATTAVTPACGRGIQVSASRTGGHYDPKPPDCEIRFEETSYQEAAAKYYEIGQVWLSGPSAVGELTSSQNDMIRPEACKMGGDIVVFGSTVSETAVFVVLRESK